MLAIPESAMIRRRFLASMTLMAGVVCFAQRDLFAAPENLVEKTRASAAKQKITVQKLRGNVSVLMGAGGNIGVLAGRDGKLLVDAGYVGARPRITDAFAAISSDPIKHLINTHWHFDHTDGNEWLHNAGAAIVAHESTRKHLSADTRVEAWDFTFPAAPTGAIPATAFQDEHEMHINGMPVVLKYYGNAHTDSDIFAHFTDADILQTGDTFWNGFLSIHRLLDWRQYRRSNTGGGKEPRQSDRQDRRHSRAWTSRRKN